MSEALGQISQLCWKLAQWQDNLPTRLKIISSRDTVDDVASTLENVRLRVLLSLRCLGAKILVLRPVLNQFLDLPGTTASNEHQLQWLRSSGAVLLAEMVCACGDVLHIGKNILAASQNDQNLLGAWWFSCYYSTLFAPRIKVGSVADWLVQHSMLLSPYWEFSSSKESPRTRLSCRGFLFPNYGPSWILLWTSCMVWTRGTKSLCGVEIPSHSCSPPLTLMVRHRHCCLLSLTRLTIPEQGIRPDSHPPRFPFLHPVRGRGSSWILGCLARNCRWVLNLMFSTARMELNCRADSRTIRVEQATCEFFPTSCYN